MNVDLLNGKNLTLKKIRELKSTEAMIGIDPAAHAEMLKSRQVIETIVRSGKVIYGVNTGFGKFSDVRISEEDIEQLQFNLVRSHSAGVGEPFPDEIVRWILLLKANALARGNSGVRPEVAELLVEMYNRRVHPVIPSKGSVGASGDLAPLAHLALVMIGEGEARYQNRIMNGRDALRAAELEPIRLKTKEGLAILNGTQVMAAVAVSNLLRARTLLECADIIGAMTAEALLCTDTAFDERIHLVRNQTGQMESARRLRMLVTGSPLIQSHRDCSLVQDAYSVRCMPQIHGASRDAVGYVETVIEREINASTDNPLIFSEQGEVLSGGNFHGQPVALAMDFLSLAMSEIGNVSERRIAWLMDPHLNNGLPAFLAAEGGLQSGWMIAQYTAAALASENKSLCHPASADSIPTSANKEDHVSMGTIAARHCAQIIEHTETILGIEWICAAQAADFRRPLELAPMTRKAYALLRRHVGFISQDTRPDEPIRQAVHLVRCGELEKAVYGEH